MITFLYNHTSILVLRFIPKRSSFIVCEVSEKEKNK